MIKETEVEHWKEMEEVVKENLLRFLPAKALCRFRAVCSDWNRKIQDPSFALHQSNHFNTLSGFFCQGKRQLETDICFLSLDHWGCGVPDPDLDFFPGRLNIISSCNGMLLCSREIAPYFCICNPVTKEFKLLPDPWTLGSHDENETAMVLGFDPSALNEESRYEVVAAKFPDPRALTFFTYSSRNPKWRESESILFLDVDETRNLNFTGESFYFKGTAYWKTSDKKVVAFDLENEVSELILLPEETSEHGAFGQIKGEICYLCILPADPPVIRVYNLAQTEWQYEISFKVDQPLTGSPWILPGFDGKTVMIHEGLSIYSCCLVDGEANPEFKLLVDVPIDLDFSKRRRYFEYINTLAPIENHAEHEKCYNEWSHGISF